MARIAILTTFSEFLSGYSLTGIVQDQVKMLTKYGNEVFLYVNERYNGQDFDGVTMMKRMPFAHLDDYESMASLSKEHARTVRDTKAMLVTDTLQNKYDVIFTHDLVFTGWNMPYALGIMAASPFLPATRWLHWVHSIPSLNRDWWDFGLYGSNHKLIYPNKTDIVRVAEQYKTNPEAVRTIPHIKDLRTFFDFSPEACSIINTYPGLMEADVVQILPASADRLSSKRVDIVIKIMANMKKLGKSVCLFIANQWATTKVHKQDEEKYLALALRAGLIPHKEVIFSSRYDMHPDKNGELHGIYEVGVPLSILRELMMCANLFIFPTREETFGLVVPEMSLASGAYLVLNRSLQMQYEVSDHQALYFDFGSFTSELQTPNLENYLNGIAILTLGRMSQNESLRTRTRMRQLYNMDYLYLHYYSPVISEFALTSGISSGPSQPEDYTKQVAPHLLK